MQWNHVTGSRPHHWHVHRSLDGGGLSAIPAASWSDFVTGALNGSLGYLELHLAQNKFTGELSLPNIPSVSMQTLNLDVYRNDFRSLVVGNTVNYLYALNVGRNPKLTGTLPKSFFDGTNYLTTLFANVTSLSGDFPSLNGFNNWDLYELDLSDTNVNFCPDGLGAGWEAGDIEICYLNNNNVTSCLNKYPALCQYTYGRPRLTDSDSKAPTSSASTWTPMTATLLLALSVLLFAL